MDNVTNVTVNSSSNVTTDHWEQHQRQPYGVFILSYVGNGLGIFAVVLNIIFLICIMSLPNKTSPYNRFIKNLAVCDIFGSVFFLITQNWPLGPFAQILSEDDAEYIWFHLSPYIFRSIPWMFFTSYILTLTCLTISQYLASCRPHLYAELVKDKNVSVILAVIWSLAAMQILIPTIVLSSLSHLSPDDAFYQLVFISNVEMLVWLGIYTFCTCVSILLNILVYIELRKQQRKYSRRRASVSEGRNNSAPGANTRARNQAFVTVFCLSVASITCRLPMPLVSMLLITLIQDYFGFVAMCWALVAVVLLLYLVFVVDPVIYLLRMPDVRNLLTSFVTKLLKCNAPERRDVRFSRLSFHASVPTTQL